MVATPEQRRAATDPTTTQAVLAQLAAIPELQVDVAANPATSDEILDWLLTHGTPETRATFGGPVSQAQVSSSTPRSQLTSEALWAEQRGFAPAPGAGSPVMYGTTPTNAVAIAALVSVFFVAPLGLILGNIALHQIDDSGEGGRGLALAAVIIGWVGIAIGVLSVIVFVAGLRLLSHS